MSIKAILLDMDGTLLLPDQINISQRCMDVLDRAAKSDFSIVALARLAHSFLFLLLFFFYVDGNVALNALLKANHGVSGINTGNALYAIVKQVLKMLVLVRIELDEHGVGLRGEVALHDFGNLHQFLHDGIIHAAFLELDADVGTSAETEEFRVNLIATTSDSASFKHSHHPLVNGGSRHATLFCDFFEAAPRIDRYDPQYLPV